MNRRQRWVNRWDTNQQKCQPKKYPRKGQGPGWGLPPEHGIPESSCGQKNTTENIVILSIPSRQKCNLKARCAQHLQGIKKNPNKPRFDWPVPRLWQLCTEAIPLSLSTWGFEAQSLELYSGYLTDHTRTERTHTYSSLGERLNNGAELNEERHTSKTWVHRSTLCSPHRLTIRRGDTSSIIQLSFANLIKERLFALCEEFVNRKLAFGICGVQVLQPLHKFSCYTAIGVSELNNQVRQISRHKKRMSILNR